jgi:hypothetical protein
MNRILLPLVILFNLVTLVMVADDLTVDAGIWQNGSLVLYVSRVNPAHTDDVVVKVGLSGYEKADLSSVKSDWLVGIIQDTSGSITLDDFFAMRFRGGFIYNKLDRSDIVSFWTVNDSRESLQLFSPPASDVRDSIPGLIRSGTLSRLHDAVAVSRDEIVTRFKQFYPVSDAEVYDYRVIPVLVFLSDGEDIGSTGELDLLETESWRLVSNDQQELSLPLVYCRYPDSLSGTGQSLLERASMVSGGTVTTRPDDATVEYAVFGRNQRYKISIPMKRGFLPGGKRVTISCKSSIESQNISAIDVHVPGGGFISLLIILLIILLIAAVIFLAWYRIQYGSFPGITLTLPWEAWLYRRRMQKRKQNRMEISARQVEDLPAGITSDSKPGITTDTSPTRKDTAIHNAPPVVPEGKGTKLNSLKDLAAGLPLLFQEIDDRIPTPDEIQQEIEEERKEYVDEAESLGESITVDVALTVKSIDDGLLVCTGDGTLQLDDLVTCRKLPFRVIKIEFAQKQKKYTIYLRPEKKSTNLGKLFKPREKLVASKEVNIYGKSDSVVESMVTGKRGAGKVQYYWQQGVVADNNGKSIGLDCPFALMLDRIVQVKTGTSGNTLSLRVVKVTMNGPGSFHCRLADPG